MVELRNMLTFGCWPESESFIKSCFGDSRKDLGPKSKIMHETKFSLDISYVTHVSLAQ